MLSSSNRPHSTVDSLGPSPTLKQAVEQIESALRSHTPPSTENAFGLGLQQLADNLQILQDADQAPSPAFCASLNTQLMDTIGLLYDPRCPFASLVMRTVASLIRHIFLIELPKVWDKDLPQAQRRGGRGWVTGGREVGERWESMLRSAMTGVIDHLGRFHERDEKGRDVLNQSYRTPVGEHFFEPLLALVFSPDSWRVSIETKFRVFEVLGASMTKHQVNKNRLNSLVTMAQIGRLIAQDEDRTFSIVAFEVAYRMASSAGHIASAMFTDDIFGNAAESLRSKCRSIAKDRFFEEAEHLMELVGEHDPARAQTIEVVAMKHNGLVLIDENPAAVWLGRDSLTANVELSPLDDDDGDQVRVCVQYKTVRLLELTRLKDPDAMVATFHLTAPIDIMHPSASQLVPVESSSIYRLSLTFPVRQEVLFASTMSLRSKLYRKLSIKRSTTEAAIAEPTSRKASQSIAPIVGTVRFAELKKAANASKQKPEPSSTHARADHLAHISEVNMDGSSEGGTESSDDVVREATVQRTTIDPKELMLSKQNPEYPAARTSAVGVVIRAAGGARTEIIATSTSKASESTIQLQQQQQQTTALVTNIAALHTVSKQRIAADLHHSVSHTSHVAKASDSSDLSSLEGSEEEAHQTIRREDRQRTKSLHRSRTVETDGHDDDEEEEESVTQLQGKGSNRKSNVSFSSRSHGNVPASPTQKRRISDVSSEGVVGDESGNARDSGNHYRRPQKKSKIAAAAAVATGHATTAKDAIAPKKASNGNATGRDRKEAQQQQQAKRGKTDEIDEEAEEEVGVDEHENEEEDELPATLEEKQQLAQSKRKYGAAKPTLAELGSAKKEKKAKAVVEKKKRVNDNDEDEDVWSFGTLQSREKPVPGLRKPKGSAAAKLSKRLAEESAAVVKNASATTTTTKKNGANDDTEWDELSAIYKSKDSISPPKPISTVKVATSKNAKPKDVAPQQTKTVTPSEKSKSSKSIRTLDELMESDRSPVTATSAGIASRTRRSQPATNVVFEEKESDPRTGQLATLPKDRHLQRQQQHQQAVVDKAMTISRRDEQQPKKKEKIASKKSSTVIEISSPIVVTDEEDATSARGRSAAATRGSKTKSMPKETKAIDRQTRQRGVRDDEDMVNHVSDSEPVSAPLLALVRHTAQPIASVVEVVAPKSAKMVVQFAVKSSTTTALPLPITDDIAFQDVEGVERADSNEEHGLSEDETERERKVAKVGQGKGQARDSGVGLDSRTLMTAEDVDEDDEEEEEVQRVQVGRIRVANRSEPITKSDARVTLPPSNRLLNAPTVQPSDIVLPRAFDLKSAPIFRAPINVVVTSLPSDTRLASVQVAALPMVLSSSFPNPTPTHQLPNRATAAATMQEDVDHEQQQKRQHQRHQATKSKLDADDGRSHAFTSRVATEAVGPTSKGVHQLGHSSKRASIATVPRLFGSSNRLLSSKKRSGRSHRRTENRRSRMDQTESRALTASPPDNYIAQQEKYDDGRSVELDPCDQDMADTLDAFREVLLARSRARTMMQEEKYEESRYYITNQVKRIVGEACEESASIATETDKRIEVIRDRYQNAKSNFDNARSRSRDILAQLAEEMSVTSLEAFYQ